MYPSRPCNSCSNQSDTASTVCAVAPRIPPFIPCNLLTFTTALYELLCMDCDGTSNSTMDAAIQCRKSLVCEKTTLMSYDTKKTTQSRLILASVELEQLLYRKAAQPRLLQKHWPLLNTQSQQLYLRLSISKLTSLNKNFTMESEHKPLEWIYLENLADASIQLQCMLLCLPRIWHVYQILPWIWWPFLMHFSIWPYT